MVDIQADRPRDLLDLLETDGKSDIIGGVRLVLAGSGIPVPDLEEVRSLIGGKTAEIVTAHQAPVRVTKLTPLQEEWRNYTDLFIAIGFHTELKMNPEEYRSSIPSFFPRPRNWRGKFDYPLIVDERIEAKKRHKLMGIHEFIDGDQITNEEELPSEVYTTYVQGNSELVTGTFDQAMEHKPRDGEAVSMAAVDGFYLRYPDFFDDEHGRWRHAGNSRYGAVYVPFLRVWFGGPGVGADGAGGPGRRWRLLFRGNKIGT